MKRQIVTLICLITFLSANGQDTLSSRFELGIRTKKYVGFYLQSGFSGEFSFEKILHHKLQFGFNMVSSRLGSAMIGNAVPTVEAELSVIKHFRHDKDLQPLLRLNFGYAAADYGSDEFNDLPQSAAILSLETGLSYRFPFAEKNMRLTATGGYNIITGRGVSGLGTVYPLYGQLSLFYKLR
jgi:hypothetical protein